MKTSLKSFKGQRGFTLIEVSMAIALVAIGLTVGVLGYNGYQAWASTTARKENAQNLVSAVNQFKALGGGPITSTSFAAGPVTVTRAQAIYDQIAGPSTLPPGVQIVPPNFELPASAEFPTNWNESAEGIFAPIPTN